MGPARGVIYSARINDTSETSEIGIASRPKPCKKQRERQAPPASVTDQSQGRSDPAQISSADDPHKFLRAESVVYGANCTWSGVLGRFQDQIQKKCVTASSIDYCMFSTNYKKDYCTLSGVTARVQGQFQQHSIAAPSFGL